MFREPWEAQAFAMTLALHERGLFTWPEWAATLGEEIKRAQAAGDPDTGETYYHHWLNALERLVAEKGVDRRGDACALPARLGPCGRPHAARRADRTEAARLPAARIAPTTMTTVTIGAAKITRIEESYEPNFEARTFFTDWRDEIVAEHLGWMVPHHFDAAERRG